MRLHNTRAVKHMQSDHVQKVQIARSPLIFGTDSIEWFFYNLCQMFHVAYLTFAYSTKVSS